MARGANNLLILCCVVCALSMGLIPLVLSWRLMEHHDASRGTGGAVPTPRHPSTAPLLPRALGAQRAALAHRFNALQRDLPSGGRYATKPLESVAGSLESALSDELARGGVDALVQKFTNFLARAPAGTREPCDVMLAAAACQQRPGSSSGAVAGVAAGAHTGGAADSVAGKAAVTTTAAPKPSCATGVGIGDYLFVFLCYLW